MKNGGKVGREQEVLKEVGVKWREITERWTWGKGSEAIA
jgi:hypothetical protein